MPAAVDLSKAGGIQYSAEKTSRVSRLVTFFLWFISSGLEGKGKVPRYLLVNRVVSASLAATQTQQTRGTGQGPNKCPMFFLALMKINSGARMAAPGRVPGWRGQKCLVL